MTVPTAAPAPGPTRRARVGREAVVDADGAVVGYELLFHPAAGPRAAGLDAAARDASTSGVITAAFGHFAGHVLGQRRQLYVNAPRAFFTTSRDLPVNPAHVVLEILSDIDVDDQVVSGAAALKQRGFRLAVDGWTSGPAFEDLLPLVDVVKTDLSTLAHDTVVLEEFVDYVNEVAPTALVLADGVEDEQTRTMCVVAGFDLLQGPLFHRRSGKASATSISQLASLRLLATLCDEDASFDDVERVVSTDPGLSLRVLGSVNSVAGARHEVRSLRQALVLVGRRQLGAWVMLGAINGRADAGREECIDVLTRARTCELLTAHVPEISPAAAYAAGLVAGVVDVLGADPETVLRSASLQPEVRAAVLDRSGTLGRVLLAVDEFDATGTTASPGLCTEDVARAHLHALGSAVETVDSLLGD